jgi:hypothetical protein
MQRGHRHCTSRQMGRGAPTQPQVAPEAVQPVQLPYASTVAMPAALIRPRGRQAGRQALGQH